MSELLAFTNAAMLSMKTSHDLSRSKAETSSQSVGGIFSPLNDEKLHAANSALSLDSKPLQTTPLIEGRPSTSSASLSSPIIGSGSVVVFPSKKSDLESMSNPVTSKALLNDSGSTPSPLTVSAHDIDGGSWDFTELASGVDVSSRQQNDDHVLGLVPSRLKLEESVSTLRSRQVEHVVFTPPQTTSSPSGPIRVRMSAKKLREIQSPYSSDQSTLSDSSTARKESSRNPAPKVMTLSASEQHLPASVGTCIKEKSRSHKQPYYRQLEPSSNQVLKQGVLCTAAAHQEDSKDDTSDDSIVIARSGSDGKHRKLKLLQLKTDEDHKEPSHMNPHPVFRIVDVPVASTNENHSNNGSNGKVRPLHPVRAPPPSNSHHNHHDDGGHRLGHRLEETVKLVASCTAAATAAAVLASNEGGKENKKPVSSSNSLGNSSWLVDGVEKVPSSPTHSNSGVHSSIKTNIHSSGQETLKNNKACGNNELDVGNNNHRQQQQQHQQNKQVSHITRLKNNKALSNELQSGSTGKEELFIVSHCDEGQGVSLSPLQHTTHFERKPLKRRAKMAAQFPTTDGTSKKSKGRTRHLESGDDSPSLLPISQQSLLPMDHRGYNQLQSYYASRSSEIQMNDVLQRLQKLEEFQHAHAMGAIKGVYGPHSSDHLTSNKSLSEKRRPSSHWSENADRTATTPGEREFNFTSVSSLPLTMTTATSYAPLGTQDTNSPFTTTQSGGGNKGGSAHSTRPASVHMETMSQLHAKPSSPEKGMQKVTQKHDAPGTHTRLKRKLLHIGA